MTDQPQQTVIIPSRPMRSTSIKGLIPALPERGKIKIGAKGAKRQSQRGTEWQPPIKLDHFLVTTLARGPDDNLLRDEQMHERFGDKPTEIPIRLLYDDPGLNFPTRYAAYNGRTLWCSGDGETALRMSPDGKGRFELQCPCSLADPTYSPQRGDPPRCKMNGSLSVIIDGASGLGGVWKFRTTSYNSINGILSSMMFLRSITGGVLANIPLKLKVQPKQASNPVDGSSVLIYVVTLEFEGDMEDLQQRGHQIALARAATHISIAEIETEARRMLALAAPANAPLPGDDAEDVRAEFYPESYDEAPDSWTDSPQSRPTRAQFRQPTEEQLDEAEQATTELMSDESEAGRSIKNRVEESRRMPVPSNIPPHTYVVSLADGTETEPMDEVGAYEAMVMDMRARAKVQGFEGLAAAWQDNASLIEALEGDGHLQVVADLRKDYMAITSQLHKQPLVQPHPAGDPPDRPRAARGTTSSGGAILPSPPVDASPAQQGSPAAQTRPDPDASSPASSGAPTPQGRDVPRTNPAGQVARPLDANLPTRLYSEKEVVPDTPRRTSEANKAPLPVAEQTPKPAAGGEASLGPDRSIACEQITYGPNRGTDWKRTTSAMVDRVKTLDLEEYKQFRKVNGKLLAQMAISWKEGIVKVNEALAARDQELMQ